MTWETVMRKKGAVRAAEAEGIVADSMDVRKALMARVHAGEITLGQAQEQLKQLKAGARTAGKTTRARAFREG